MKLVFSTLVAFFFFSYSFSQTIFDKFEDKESITAVVVNKKMFDLMSKVKVDPNDTETLQYMNLIKKLTLLKVFSTTNIAAANELKLAAEKHFQQANLEELLRGSEMGKNVKISVKSIAGTTSVQELLMVIEQTTADRKFILLSLTGNFSLSEIAILTDKMKIQGGDELKKASKKK